MICRVCLVIFLSVSCDSYKLINDWRWLDIPNIYQLNQRQYSSERSRSRQSSSYGRSDLSSQSDWSWRDVREEDDRDVVVHMKRNHQKTSRLSDRSQDSSNRKPYVPFNSLTFSSLKEGVKEPVKEVSTKAPWWSLFTRSSTSTTLQRESTTTSPRTKTTRRYQSFVTEVPLKLQSFTQEATEKISISTTEAPQRYQSFNTVNFRPAASVAVSSKRKQQSTIGKLINVTEGSVPTKMLLGLIVKDKSKVWSPPSIIEKSKESLETFDTFETEESDSVWENDKEGESMDKNVDNDKAVPINQEEETSETDTTAFWSTFTTPSTTTTPSSTTTTTKSSVFSSTTKFNWMEWLANRSKLTVETTISTSTTSTTTTASTTTKKPSLQTTTNDLPLWTWWTPDIIDDGNDEVDTDSDAAWEQGAADKIDDRVVTKEINDEEEVSNRDNRESDDSREDPDDEESEDLEEDSEDETIDHEELRDKYIELMNHNTKLVDVLKKTLEMQADMFRRLIKYLFP